MAAAQRIAAVESHLGAQHSAASPAAAGPGKGTLWNPKADSIGEAQSLKGKTLFITGSSRGIGLCIAKTAAREGANVVVAAKTAEPHPTLPGTIHTAAAEIDRLGGRGLACVVDVRDEASVQRAVEAAVARFGGIDVLINCASAIFPQPTEKMDAGRLNLMFEVGSRGSMFTAKHCIPHLRKSAAAGRNPHILNLSPPVDLTKMAQQSMSMPNYMIGKMGMTIGAMGMASELRKAGIAANTLWPTGLVATSALNHHNANNPDRLDKLMQRSKVPQIQADAARAIITSDAAKFSGNQTIDEDVLRRTGVTDFKQYDYMTLGRTRDERLKGLLNY